MYKDHLSLIIMNSMPGHARQALPVLCSLGPALWLFSAVSAASV